MTAVLYVLVVYLAGVVAVTLYWIPGNMRRAAQHIASGESSAHFMPVFVSLACALTGGVFWPWNLVTWARWRIRNILHPPPTHADLLAMIREAVGRPLPPIVACSNDAHHRGNACPRCRHTAYCDDCASCGECRFAAPWANDFDPLGCVRHQPEPPAATRCGLCGGVPIHTRFCSATRTAVHRSTVSR